MIFNSSLAPTEILADKDLMAQIRKGKRKDVKSRDFEEFAEELGI
jgi:hypothetical protein